MKCGIEIIDNTLGEKGFPTKGLVSITGSSEIYQSRIMKEIALNIASYFPAILVISTKFGQWTTKDISTKNNISILEIEQPDLFRNIQAITLAENREAYPVVFIDFVKSTTSAIDVISIKKLIEDEKSILTIVNCIGDRNISGFNLEQLLVMSSILSFKIEEKIEGDHLRIDIGMLGPYLQKNT